MGASLDLATLAEHTLRFGHYFKLKVYRAAMVPALLSRKF
jgi:hypothetical protein